MASERWLGGMSYTSTPKWLVSLQASEFGIRRIQVLLSGFRAVAPGSRRAVGNRQVQHRSGTEPLLDPQVTRATLAAAVIAGLGAGAEVAAPAVGKSAEKRWAGKFLCTNVIWLAETVLTTSRFVAPAVGDEVDADVELLQAASTQAAAAPTTAKLTL